jgi:hypothetical protein
MLRSLPKLSYLPWQRPQIFLHALSVNSSTCRRHTRLFWYRVGCFHNHVRLFCILVFLARNKTFSPVCSGPYGCVQRHVVFDPHQMCNYINSTASPSQPPHFSAGFRCTLISNMFCSMRLIVFHDPTHFLVAAGWQIDDGKDCGHPPYPDEENAPTESQPQGSFHSVMRLL